jgi:hypothetical protein
MRAIPLFGKTSGLTAIRSKDANLLVRELNKLLAITVERGNTNAFIYSDGNIKLSLRNISDSTTQSAVGIPVRASITALANDYVTVDLWGGTTFDAGSVNVAKPYELRHNASDTIYSTGASYSYSDTNTRTASAGGFDTETHVVLLPYEIGREILVIDTGLATGVTGCTYIDLNIGGRTWASVPSIPIP